MTGVDPTNGNPLPTEAEVAHSLNKLREHAKRKPNTLGLGEYTNEDLVEELKNRKAFEPLFDEKEDEIYKNLLATGSDLTLRGYDGKEKLVLQVVTTEHVVGQWLTAKNKRARR